MRVTSGTAIRQVGIGVMLLASHGALLAAQTSALTLPEVLDLHRSGVSPRQIVRMAQQYCIAFQVEEHVATTLDSSGADPVVLEGLRRACVMVPSSLPPGVLLDERFDHAMRFVAPDGLCTMTPTADGITIENRRQAMGCVIPYPAQHRTEGFRLELTIAALSGRSRGVVALGFGRDSATGDQITLALDDRGRVELGETVRGRFQQVQAAGVADESFDAASEHRLAVELRPGVASLFVDGRLVFVQPLRQPLADGLSFGVGPRSSARIVRFTVRDAGASGG